MALAAWRGHQLALEDRVVVGGELAVQPGGQPTWPALVILVPVSSWAAGHRCGDGTMILIDCRILKTQLQRLRHPDARIYRLLHAVLR